MDRGAVRRRLREAVREQRVELHYQPVVDLSDGATTGVEALARWQDSELGAVSPDVFIPVAEQDGLIVDLGRQLLGRACATAVAWAERPGHALTMAVNVSPIQLHRASFVDAVREALDSSGLAPERLCLEITETAIVTDVDEAATILRLLSDLGVRFALDDFGTGHSSLTLLRNLPLDLVKIDRSLVRGVSSTAQDAVLVQLVVDAAHTIGLRVCAEGVEGTDQARQLVAMGCDTGQGWLFGRAVPATEIGGPPGHPATVPRVGTPEADGVAGNARPHDAAEAPAPQGVPAQTAWLDPTMSAPVVLSGSADLVVLADPARVTNYVSAACRRILGRMPSELVGTHLDALLGGRHDEGPVSACLRHVDGGRRWLRGRVQPLLDGTGQVREILCVLSDETATVTRDRALADSEELFRSAFDAAPIGIALSDLEGRWLRVNPTLARLLGFTVTELVGMRVADVTHPDDLHVDEQNLAEVLAGSVGRYQVRKRYLDAHGRTVPVEVHASEVRSAEGQPYCIVAHVVPAGPPVPTQPVARP